MGYTPVLQRNNAGANIKPKSVGGYVPVSARNAGGSGEYLPVENRPVGYKPPTTTPSPETPAPSGPSFIQKTSDIIGNTVNRPSNKVGEIPTRTSEDYAGMTREEKKKALQEEAKVNTEIAEKSTFKKQLPSAIVEALPFGLGQAFKQIHDMEKDIENAPYIANSPKEIIKEVPGALKETAQGFIKAPISGAINVYDAISNKKTKFNIPGLGEVSSAQYRTASRVADGEDPVQVALEEGSTAILDTLFFASLATKPFQGRPTVTAKSEVPASTFEKVPGSSKSLTPKSFRLYEKKTSATPLSPEFIEKAKAQGVDFGAEFKPERSTYFRMTFDPKKNAFVGEIVQIKPAWVSVIVNKFKGDISKAPEQAINVLSAPKEVSVKSIEQGLKTPIVESKPPETTTSPIPQKTTQERTDLLLGKPPKKEVVKQEIKVVEEPKELVELEEVSVPPEIEARANEEWENEPQYGERVGVLADEVSTLEKQIKDLKDKNEKAKIQAKIDLKNKEINDINESFAEKWRKIANEKPPKVKENKIERNPETERDLAEEARKYKSVEKFIKSRTPIAQFTEEGKPGKFWTTPEGADEGFGSIRKDAFIDTSKLFKGTSSLDFIEQRGLLTHEIRKRIKNAIDSEDPNKQYEIPQEIAEKILQKEGYSGAYWTYEDDLNPTQYQVWDKSVIKTESELTDFYNKAVGQKDKPKTKDDLMTPEGVARDLIRFSVEEGKTLKSIIDSNLMTDNRIVDTGYKAKIIGGGKIEISRLKGKETSHIFSIKEIYDSIKNEGKEVKKSTKKEDVSRETKPKKIEKKGEKPTEKPIKTIGDVIRELRDTGLTAEQIAENSNIPLEDVKAFLKYDKTLEKKYVLKTENKKPSYKGGSEGASVGEFSDGTPIELGNMDKVHPIEFPELVDLARDLMGKVPEITKRLKTSRGKFIGKEGGEILLKNDIFENPEKAAKTLAHEIGHLIDFLPEGTLARGNLLGRLKTLRKFMSETFGEKEQPTNTKIKEELMEVTEYWRPYDIENSSKSYVRYRQSARELYADALSMLLNTPGTLEKMAPTFYKEFFDGLDAKPAVFNAYFELQDLLGGERGALLERRRAGVRGMFEAGDLKAAEIQKVREAKREAKNKDFSFQFKFNVIDKNYAIIDRLNQLKKEGKSISDDENPLYFLEERNYLGGKIKAFMEKNIQPIYKKLGDNGISWTDFGEALFYERIASGDRSDVANPRGITPKAAQELRDKMEEGMTPEQVKMMEKAVLDFREAVKSIAEEAFDEGLYNPEMHEHMMKNPAYATFQVLDHMEEGMTSKIHKSLGTLKDVSNPADASLLKTISTLRAIERNKTTRAVVDFLNKNFKDDIKEATYLQTPKGKIPQESKIQGEELITYMKNGKRLGYYVDPYIKYSVENETIGHTIGILKILNSNLFRPLFITYNPGFQAFNFIRDFKRFWKNTPNMTIIKALQRYKQSIPAARARAFGELTNETLQKMEGEQILSISYNQLADGADAEAKQIDTILERSGIDSFKPEVKYKALQPFIKVLDFVKNMGDFIETLPKVAGYLEFTEGGKKEITREEKSFIRKNIGSPDFLAGGFWKPVTNEVFLFSNAITQGIRSDVGVATNPKTRGGYWYKTAKANMLPKVLMLLASLGYFGKEVEEMMNDVSEYDKTNYIIVPLGKDENGKTIYLRVPQDEGGRLIGGLTWKLINSANNNQSLGKDLIDVATFAGGQLPSVSPSITSVVATGQFLAGQNPYDWFRNREVLTDDQFKAGGIYAAKPFLGWLFNQSGGGVFYHFTQTAPRDKSGPEKLFNLPLVGNIAGRFVKVSDYGQTEEANKIKKEVQSEQARRRLDENGVINDYIKDAQKGMDDKSIEELVSKNKVDLVNDVLGHAPSTEAELIRAKNIVKKYQIGLKRGESDPIVNSLISAATNEEKIELLTEIRKQVSKQEYNKLILDSIKYKIVSPEVFIKIPNPATKK